MDTNDVNRRLRYALSLDDSDVMGLLALSGWSADINQVKAWRHKEGEEGFAACPADAVRAMLDGLILKHRGPRDSQSNEPSDSAGAGSQTASGSNLQSASGSNLINPVAKNPDNKQAAGLNTRIDNNHLLKQLRIALSLKVDDVRDVIALGGGNVSKGEVSAFFRKPDARNYRPCGDQLLRAFFRGMAVCRQNDAR